MSRLKLTLEENAISFAEDALANAIVAEETPKRWKFAILSLIQAIELSLKELLRRQHPYPIYKNVDNPDKTVGIDQATHRFRLIAGITLTADGSCIITWRSQLRTLSSYSHDFSVL